MAANAERPDPGRRAATGPMAGPGRHIFAAHLFAGLLRHFGAFPKAPYCGAVGL
jgi:hypothetical protein